MGGWYITKRDADPASTQARIAAAQKQFALHGFATPELLETPSHIGFAVPYINGGPILHARSGEDWIAAAGTLFYQGKTGPEALRTLLADFRFPFTDWQNISGHFGLIVAKGGTIHVLTDFFGAFQIFHDDALTSISTSFMTLAAERKTARFNTQAVNELVLNIFPTGDDTVLESIARLGPDRQLTLGRDARAERVDNKLPRHGKGWSPDHRRALLDSLRARVAEGTEAWGNNIQTPLTAGLDSRLLLALLREAGAKPHVYIYGQAGETDVEIPQMIADAEGFPLDVFNKADWPILPPDAFAEQVRANFNEIDAMATDGSMFDMGSNSHGRHLRSANGALAASGGCGEVFRNFFYLPDCAMDAVDVVRAFYSRYDPRDLTPMFSASSYERIMVDKIKTALQTDRSRLDRRQVDEIYPRVRCRAFFGREISIVGRFGGYLMPCLDHHLVSWSLDIPQSLRRVGRLQAELMTEIDPKLASYTSGYGHSFDAPTSRKAALNELISVHRSPWVRKYMYRIRNRFFSHENEAADFLSPDYLGRVIDLDYPVMRRFFNIESIRDPNMVRRIAKLEYFAAWMGGRLVQ